MIVSDDHSMKLEVKDFCTVPVLIPNLVLSPFSVAVALVGVFAHVLAMKVAHINAPKIFSTSHTLLKYAPFYAQRLLSATVDDRASCGVDDDDMLRYITIRVGTCYDQEEHTLRLLHIPIVYAECPEGAVAQGVLFDALLHICAYSFNVVFWYRANRQNVLGICTFRALASAARMQ